jgi:hypothetical protein
MTNPNTYMYKLAEVLKGLATGVQKEHPFFSKMP